jgi:hypothetical protein
MFTLKRLCAKSDAEVIFSLNNPFVNALRAEPCKGSAFRYANSWAESPWLSTRTTLPKNFQSVLIRQREELKIGSAMFFAL